MSVQRDIRRKDRAISTEQAWEVLRQGEYGVLSTVSPEGQPYGTPVNYCVLDGAVYFHCALEGHKLDNLAANPRVCFCVVGKSLVVPSKFAVEYESAVVFGSASEVIEPQKQKALEGLVDKYSPDFHQAGMAYISNMTAKARVFKISVESISGKARSF